MSCEWRGVRSKERGTRIDRCYSELLNGLSKTIAHLQTNRFEETSLSARAHSAVLKVRTAPWQKCIKQRSKKSIVKGIQARLQQAGELGVAIRDAALLIAQCRDDSPQGQEGLVNVHRLPHACAISCADSGCLRALAACKVNHMQLTGSATYHLPVILTSYCSPARSTICSLPAALLTTYH